MTKPKILLLLLSGGLLTLILWRLNLPPAAANLLANPEITIQVGWRKMAVTAVPLNPEQSGQAMVDYAHRYPTAAKVLSKRLLGYEVDGSDEDYYALGHDAVPFVALQPREGS